MKPQVGNSNRFVHSLRRRARSLTLVGFVDRWLEARAKPNIHKEKNRIFHAQSKARYRIVAQNGVVCRLSGLLFDSEHSRYVLEPNVSRQQLADSSSLGADSTQLLKVTLGLHTAEAGRNPRASLGHNATKNDFKFPPKGLRRLVLSCMPSKSGGNITFMAFGACLCASNSSSFTNLHSFESQGDTALPVYDRSA